MSFIERSFYELNPDYEFVSGFHIEKMADLLESVRQGKIRRLIINLPPRSLKSHTVSIAFPAYLLGSNPSSQIICASYGQDLADKLARDTRTLVKSAFYQAVFPGTQLAEDRQAVNDFFTTKQGFRMATSVNGVLTGRGADYLIIDDALKPDDALSETKRTGVNAWFDNTLLSRLNNKQTGVIIIVMQRLHEDDLVGHVLEKGDWMVLSFPSIAREEEVHRIESPLGARIVTRHPGDVLQPGRESRETLDTIRKTIGDYNFASQYQQQPMPLEGNMIKQAWLQTYECLPERFSLVLQSWDTANKAGELNDYSVCTTWGYYNLKLYLLDVFRKKLTFPDLKRTAIELRGRFRPVRIFIEDRASGTQLVQELKSESIPGVYAVQRPPHSDKVMRLYGISVYFERGEILLPREAPWLEEYKRELTSFPGTKYDDQVDSTTQALENIEIIRTLRSWIKVGQQRP